MTWGSALGSVKAHTISTNISLISSSSGCTSPDDPNTLYFLLSSWGEISESISNLSSCVIDSITKKVTTSAFKATPPQDGVTSEGYYPYRCEIITGPTGHIYRVGGFFGSADAAFLDYTISSNSWTTKAAPTQNRSNMRMAFFCNGKLWLPYFSSGSTFGFHTWNPSTNTWTYAAHTFTDANVATALAASDPTVTFVVDGTTVYIVSGTVSGNRGKVQLSQFNTTALTHSVLLNNMYVTKSEVYDQAVKNINFASSSVDTLPASRLHAAKAMMYTDSSTSEKIILITFPDGEIVNHLKRGNATQNCVNLSNMIGVSLTDLRPCVGYKWIDSYSEYLAALALDNPANFYSGTWHKAVGIVGDIIYSAYNAYSVSDAAFSLALYHWAVSKKSQIKIASSNPGADSIISSSYPTLQATLEVPVGTSSPTGPPFNSSPDTALKYNAEWVLAKDSTYVTNRRTVFGTTEVTNPDGSTVISAADSTTGTSLKAGKVYQGSPDRLAGGDWYMNIRMFSGPFKTAWALSNSSKITVSHPPTATAYEPNGDTTKAFGPIGISWGFFTNSIGDYQTAYQILVEKNSDGSTVWDSGKVASTGSSAIYTPAVGVKDIQLRWKVRVWDNDDVVGAYSAYNLFRVSDAPTVTINTPVNGSELTSGSSLVQWTFAASGGRTQSKYRVRFYKGGTALAYDSEWLIGAVSTHNPANSFLQVGSYVVRVDVEDNRGLQGYSQNTFTTNFIVPERPTFTINEQNYVSTSAVTLNWSPASDESLDTIGYVVYGRSVGSGASWIKLGEIVDLAASYTFNDYLAPSNVTREYIVTQKALRWVGAVESLMTPYVSQSVTPISDKYILLHPTDPSKNLWLLSVNEDSYSDEYEQADIDLIGRGRTRQYGTHFGYKGSILCKLRGPSARAIKLQITAMAAETESVYLRNPFGDIWKVALDTISYSRIPGVGSLEFVDVTIPYQEVK